MAKGAKDEPLVEGRRLADRMANEPRYSRLAKYRGQWVVMQANVGEEDTKASGPDNAWEQDSVWVQNLVAAKAPELLRIFRELVRRYHGGPTVSDSALETEVHALARDLGLES